MRVFARQDNQPFFFAKIFGQTTFGAPAEAIASADPAPLDVMMVLDLSQSMEQAPGALRPSGTPAPVFVDVIEQLEGDDYIGVMGLSADPDRYDPADEGPLRNRVRFRTPFLRQSTTSESSRPFSTTISPT